MWSHGQSNGTYHYHQNNNNHNNNGYTADEEMLHNWYSGDTSATTTFGTMTPTTPTLTLTPTTLASIEQTFIELQSVPVTSSAQDLSRQSGFVPPVVDPVTKPEPAYTDYYDTDSTDGEWMPSPPKKTRTDTMPSVINYVGSALVTSSTTTPNRKGGRKRRDDNKLTPEEEEKRRVRRERNKLAAAKCRQRRVDQTNTLIAQTEGLEEEKASLENEIQTLQQQKEQLEFLLEAHKPMCKSAKFAAGVNIKVKVEKEQESVPQPLVIVTSTPGPKPLPEGLATTSRPNSLPLPSRTSATEATGVVISTPSSGVFATLGLDSMVDGHTGLTPIMGGPSCGSEVQRSSSDSGSTSDALGSPTLMAL